MCTLRPLRAGAGEMVSGFCGNQAVRAPLRESMQSQAVERPDEDKRTIAYRL